MDIITNDEKGFPLHSPPETGKDRITNSVQNVSNYRSLWQSRSRSRERSAPRCQRDCCQGNYHQKGQKHKARRVSTPRHQPYESSGRLNQRKNSRNKGDKGESDYGSTRRHFDNTVELLRPSYLDADGHHGTNQWRCKNFRRSEQEHWPTNSGDQHQEENSQSCHNPQHHHKDWRGQNIHLNHPHQQYWQHTIEDYHQGHVRHKHGHHPYEGHQQRWRNNEGHRPTKYYEQNRRRNYRSHYECHQQEWQNTAGDHRHHGFSQHNRRSNYGPHYYSHQQEWQNTPTPGDHGLRHNGYNQHDWRSNSHFQDTQQQWQSINNPQQNYQRQGNVQNTANPKYRQESWINSDGRRMYDRENLETDDEFKKKNLYGNLPAFDEPKKNPDEIWATDDGTRTKSLDENWETDDGTSMKNPDENWEADDDPRKKNSDENCVTDDGASMKNSNETWETDDDPRKKNPDENCVTDDDPKEKYPGRNRETNDDTIILNLKGIDSKVKDNVLENQKTNKDFLDGNMQANNDCQQQQEDGEEIPIDSSNNCQDEKRQNGNVDCSNHQPSTNGENLASIIAKHYNEIKMKGLKSREESKIAILRKFNNWTKSMAFNDAIRKLHNERKSRRSLIGLDLCCGKGGDLSKWEKAMMMKHVVFVDIAEVSLNECRERYEKMKIRNQERLRTQRGGRHLRPLFTAEFIIADCTRDSLRSKLSNPDINFDIVSCQFALHYSFESFTQANQMLRNATENLVSSGYFIGTVPNADRIVRHGRECGKSEFGNEVYKVKFECEEPYPIFGARYFFQLEDAVSCPEFLVHFPTLQLLASRFGLDLVYRTTFDEFHRIHGTSGRGKFQLHGMRAVEFYPPHRGEHMRYDMDKYEHAAHFIEDLKRKQPQRNWDGFRVTTISSVEWEAIMLYLAFCFRKK